MNRSGSNLSRETVLNSLRMTYGYDGGPELLAHLEEYFDTPEHAAFAIQLATNPHWDRYPGGSLARTGQRMPASALARFSKRFRQMPESPSISIFDGRWRLPSFFPASTGQPRSRFSRSSEPLARTTAKSRRRRTLKDDQKERWRAYLILRKIVQDAGHSDAGRRAAQLAVRRLRGISTDGFGREEEIRKADIELSSRIRQFRHAAGRGMATRGSQGL